MERRALLHLSEWRSSADTPERIPSFRCGYAGAQSAHLDAATPPELSLFGENLAETDATHQNQSARRNGGPHPSFVRRTSKKLLPLSFTNFASCADLCTVILPEAGSRLLI